MTRKRPAIKVPIPDDLREAVLDIAVTLPDGEITTVGLLVQTASEAVAKANEALRDNGLVRIAVRDLMREHRRRGAASVVVDARGNVMLHIGEGADTGAITHTTAPGGAGLPSIARLREIAAEQGVDISDLGRQKREIMKRLSDRNREPAPDKPPTRLRDEVRTSTPLPDVRLPR